MEEGSVKQWLIWKKSKAKDDSKPRRQSKKPTLSRDLSTLPVRGVACKYNAIVHSSIVNVASKNIPTFYIESDMASTRAKDLRLHQEPTTLPSRARTSSRSHGTKFTSSTSSMSSLLEDGGMGPRSTLFLRPGIVLFDPKDLEACTLRRTSSARSNVPMGSRKSSSRSLLSKQQHGDTTTIIPQELDIDDIDSDEETNDKENDHLGNVDVRDSDRCTEEVHTHLRNKAVDEICVTERSYVNDMQTLLDFYIVPLEDNRHPITEDAQIAVFFNNLRQLGMLNSKLLTDLEQIVERRDSENVGDVSGLPTKDEGIGAVFCRYAPLFKLYAGYAKDYEEVASLLQSYSKDRRLGFTSFLESCQQRSGSQKSFESLLIMPVQRIPRYKLLLERVLQYTDPSLADKTFLRDAVNRVTVAASWINESIREQESLGTVLQTQKQFVGQLSLLTPNRRLLKSGKMIKMSTKRPEEVMVHLFNDLLLYSSVLLTGGYRVRRVIYLNSPFVEVQSKVTTPVRAKMMFSTRKVGDRCTFVFYCDVKAIVLSCQSLEDKESWVEAIQSAIDQVQSTEDESDLVESFEMPWVPDSVSETCSVCQASFKLLFRRHHCRRCGSVVCGNCSSHRSVLFSPGSYDPCQEERVCTPCFQVLSVVKKAAYRWLDRIVQYRGVLRRQRYRKWSEHYYELRGGTLRQYPLPSSSQVPSRCCSDSMDLAGAIVIHRADTHVSSYRFCFQLSSGNVLDSPSEYSGSNDESVTDTESNMAMLTSASTLMSKLSPFKHAVSRTIRYRDMASPSNVRLETGWTLCAASFEDEVGWSTALQRAADRALTKRQKTHFSLDSTSSRSLYRQISKLEIPTDESAKVEHRRLQILKELLRSEELFVSSMSECTRIFVQPLLLRQLEAQKMVRQQGRSRKLLRNPFGASTGSSMRGVPASGGSSAIQTMGSSTRSIHCVKTVKTVHKKHSFTMSMETGMTATQKIMLLDADMAIFFSSVDQICTLNQQLLDHLCRHFGESSERMEASHRAGAIFNAYAPLFQLYASYASRHESALNAIASPQFAQFLSELPEEASVRRLQTYLNMPMERIPRYKIFLQELLEATPMNHVDYVPLQSALEHVNTVASRIQQIIDRRENARRIDEISARVGMELPGRRVVKDGVLRKVCRSKVKKYYFVLFDDAILYGRHGHGLQKKKYQLLELWECRLSDDTDSIPAVIDNVVGSDAAKHAFNFFSPHKSFILLTDSEEEKKGWTEAIQACIERSLQGPPSSRSSERSDGFLEDESSEWSGNGELESAFVIKNGWLNVASEEKKPSRLWVSLTLQTLSLSSTFKASRADESYSMEACSIRPLPSDLLFTVTISQEQTKKTLVLETTYRAEKEEWVRALTHCASGQSLSTGREMRRRSMNSTSLAPVFMFDKASNVCTICLHSFAVYRPRHHCRLCGALVCGNCSKRKWNLSYGASSKASRLCDRCAESTLSTSSSLYAHH